jgi:hypothetical protein
VALSCGGGIVLGNPQGARYDHTAVEEPSPHPASLDDEALLRECRVERGRFRLAGPGGQHRNKVETGVRLLHEPTGLSAQASERRQQTENQRVALRRLRLVLALHVRRPVRLHPFDGYEPSERWRRHADPGAGALRVNPDHRDLPAILAEAMDLVSACDFDVREAATLSGVTMTQLVKLLRIEPEALERINAERASRSQRRLK